MRRLKRVAVLALLLSLVNFTASATNDLYIEGEDLAAPIFNPQRVIDIDLRANQSELNKLWGAPKEYVIAEMRVKLENSYTSYFPVEMRLKGGLGSLRNLYGKAAFKIKIPKEHRAFVGNLKKLTLNNMVQDWSSVHEAISYRVFRAMNVAAPRVGYATVSLNGAEYGLYSHIETVDDRMLERWFYETQHLYEGSYWMDVWPDNEGAFEVDEGDPYNRSDLRALTQINRLSGINWYRAFQLATDYKQMLDMWATEIYIGHWDGYAHTIKNNYYLHSDYSNKFSMLPWGVDQTWWDYLDFYDTWDRSIMFTKCMEVVECKFEYQRSLYKVHKTVKSLDLVTMINNLESVLAPYVQADPRKEYWHEEGYWARQSTRDFIYGRSAQVDSMFVGVDPGVPALSIKKLKARTQVTWLAESAVAFPENRYEVWIKIGKSKPVVRSVSINSLLLKFQKVPTRIKIRSLNSFTEGEWSPERIIKKHTPKKR